MTTKLKSVILPIVVFLLAAPIAQAAVSFPYGSGGWKYRLGTTEASAPITAWRQLAFDDSTWNQNATGPIGYDTGGTPGTTLPIATTTPTSGVADGNFLSIYFRKIVDVPDPSSLLAATLEVTADDGSIVWVNGFEVGRINMPAGDPTLATVATAATTPEVNILNANILSRLVAGPNVIAIQAFNVNNTSTDLVMDGTLAVTEDTPPVVEATIPTANATVTSLSFINVLFNEPVTGVNALDLLINNNPATNLTVVNPREYVFYFPQPATGTVAISWAPGHGIADMATVPKPFVANTWNYTLDPNAMVGTAIISEFVASNEHGAEDEDGSREDWVEVYNTTTLDLNLNGWYLTDTATNLTKWRFPSVNLGPNKYMLIWASEKNRTNPAAALHTNFKLASSGGYLALVNPSLSVVSVFNPYPAQVPDNSYGRDRVDPNLVGYYVTPTPGAQNATSGVGYAPDIVFSMASGIYTNSSLSVSLSAPGAGSIRYTTDGTEPTSGSTLYSTPITVSGCTILKARSFQGSLWPSAVGARNYILLDSTTANFSSDIPILVIAAPGTIPSSVIAGGARRRGQVAVFDTFRGRAALTGKVDFHGLAQFETFGQTSEGFPKKPHNIEINDNLGNDMAASLLGMPSEADWKLRNPYSDKCLMNDFLAYELFEQMGNYSCRRRFVEVFRTQTAGAKLNYSTDYYGVLVLLEKIERSKDRVNLAELQPGDTNEPAISGGYMFKRDKASTGDLDFTTAAGTAFKMHEPKPRELNNSVSHPHVQWLRNYLNLYETAANAGDFTTRTGTNHYSYYLDVDSFVDSHWIVEFPKQIDGYRISNYFSKDRKGKLKNVPIWDWNLSFGNANYLQGGMTNGWYYTQLGAGDHPFLRRLVGAGALPASGGDPDFIQKIIDRWGTLRTNLFNGTNVNARIDQLAATLAESAVRDFARFPRLYPVLTDTTPGYVWPNPNGASGGWHVDYVSPSTYGGIISEMKKWTMGRYLWVDSQFMRAPTFGLNPGVTPAGSVLPITALAGTIYYTLDGTDPRAAQTAGALAPGAITYSGPVTLNSNARVFSRARSGGVWSPPTIGTFVVQTPPLVITEIMYHPAGPATGTNVIEDYEFIELKNTSGASLALGGITLSGSVTFTFPTMTLGAGQRVLVVNNLAAFSSRYNTNGLLIAGEYIGELGNDGSQLILTGGLGEPIHDFSYDNDWYRTTDGFGFSLVLVNEAAPLNTWGLPASWRAGTLNGSPGLDNGAAPSFASVVINEVLTHSDTPPPTDTIELRNLSGATASIGGWFLTDDFNTPKKFRIPVSTTIEGNGTVTFTEADFNNTNNTVGNLSFALSSLGDEIYLFSGDANTNLTGYVQGFDFGAQADGRTFGRHVISTGADHFVAQASATLGGPNSGPLVGPLVISEIHYHPVDFVNSYGTFDNSEDEYIELHNISGVPVPLFDSTNRWRLRDAVEFTFPPSTTIPAGGYALIVSFDPANSAALASFRANNGVPVSVPVYGPYAGQLDNSADSVELAKPDVVIAGVVVPYVLVDKVRYADVTPWPAAADGFGLSLQRKVESSYGNDPTNWVAGGRSPGASYVPGPAPVITQQPQSSSAIASASVTLSVRASSPQPLSFQWRKRPVGGSSFVALQGASSSNLTFNPVKVSDSGTYDCIIANTAAGVTSDSATLTVIIPATISQHPTNLFVFVPPDIQAQPNRTAIFRVVATTDNPPLLYRWQFNSNDIPLDSPYFLNANSAVLTVTNVLPEHGGFYRVAVTDAFGTIYSSNAVLNAMVSPFIIKHPESQTVLQGDTLNLSIYITNVATGPFSYVWRRGSLQIATNVSTVHSNFFSVTNVQPIANLRYRCDVYNPATGLSFSNSLNANITVLSDFDGDHISDLWEVQYGLDTNNVADGQLDLDGDLMSNHNEFRAGTDPTDPASVLRMTDFQFGAQNTFTFLAISNRTYSVQSGVTLPNGPWLSFTNISADTINRTIQITTPVLPAPRYIRVVTPQQ